MESAFAGEVAVKGSMKKTYSTREVKEAAEGLDVVPEVGSAKESTHSDGEVETATSAVESKLPSVERYGLDLLAEWIEGAEYAPLDRFSTVAPDEEMSGAESLEEKKNGKTVYTKAIKGERPTGRYGRLFTDRKLDMLVQGEYELPKDESEGYDKELEDRLFPLDEVKLKRRMRKIAEEQKESSLEEMSKMLGIPPETLERTRRGGGGGGGSQKEVGYFYVLGRRRRL
ncbi:hypothetical protein V7S43_008452 [Phytophthora oleae]|uniref:Uncharacterized protein n=1 Tax=Phytophthora oleae TaxID=2107226 RepID=A0ABD3FMP1_9STRA